MAEVRGPGSRIKGEGSRFGDDSAEAAASPIRGWVISLLFWFSLLVAAALFASVALAPKLLAYLRLRQEFHTNQNELVRLQNRVQYLGRVAEAFKSEPEFTAELVRADFGVVPQGEDRISVDATLSLGAEAAESNPSLPAPSLPWYTPLVKRLAEDNRIRSKGLALAALLILLTFTFLHESPGVQHRSATDRTGTMLGSIIRRYHQSPDG